MNHKTSFRRSKKFRRILSKATCETISRKALINNAINSLELSEKQAAGLVDRGVCELKKQGLVISTRSRKHTTYVFSTSLINHQKLHEVNDAKSMLYREKKTLEKELSLIHYELEAYQELIKKIPQKKHKINKLQIDTTERAQKLNGKLRAVNQLLSL